MVAARHGRTAQRELRPGPGTTIVVPGPGSLFSTLRSGGSVSAMVTESVACDFCGRRADSVDTLTWTVATERGRRKRFCDECSRTHLRAMEGKLDTEHW